MTKQELTDRLQVSLTRSHGCYKVTYRTARGTWHNTFNYAYLYDRWHDYMSGPWNCANNNGCTKADLEELRDIAKRGELRD